MFKFELITIDPYNCTIEELEKEIDKLKILKEEFFGTEQSIKIFINSVYGALASPYFDGYNIFAAEAVTLQGQDISKFARMSLDDYFLNMWHQDKALHKALGITYANKIIDKSVVIYMDTDSCYLTFAPIIKSCDYKGDPIEFILSIKKLRLDSYLDKCFEQYAKSYNTHNMQELELEKIAYSALMVAKKKYILDLAWKEPGVIFQPQEKIKYVGIEIQQGSTPKYARKVLKELMNIIFKYKKNIDYGLLIKQLKKYKEEFKLQSPDDISKTVEMSDYEKYVLEDKKKIVLADKCPVHNRGSAIYNNKLLNSKLKSKYKLIKSGDKVKWYYTKDNNGVFAFLPNNFPYEIGPEIDYDAQFNKIIIQPLNRFIILLGLPEIPSQLIYAHSLF
jgi:DNA polymerase elongation subunit (family B)